MRLFFGDVKQVIQLDPTRVLFLKSTYVDVPYIILQLQTSCSVMKCNAFSTACNPDKLSLVPVVRKLEIMAEIACFTGGVLFYNVVIVVMKVENFLMPAV